MDEPVRHLNPEGLHRNPAYSQAVAVVGPVTTVYVGGQNGVNQRGEIVGLGDIGAQTVQALRNVEAAVIAAGGGLEHVVKWTVYFVEGQSAQRGFEAFVEVWGQRGMPPVVTVAAVSALASPDFLVEIEAIAAIPVKV